VEEEINKTHHLQGSLLKAKEVEVLEEAAGSGPMFLD